MNPQFELLPFAAHGQMEMAFGRGGRSGARPMPMRGPTRPQPARRGGPRAGSWPPLHAGPPQHGWPYPGPYYGSGWPYGVAPGEPYPAPAPEPEPEPPDWDDGAAAQWEAPPTLSDTLTRLPAAERPAYQALGAVGAALGDPRAAGPGLYLIEFFSDGRPRAYSGQTADLRRRLRQHALCAQMMGLSLAGHQVYVAPAPALSAFQRRALERRIHDDMFARHGGVLTNQRRELEMEVLGRQWS